MKNILSYVDVTGLVNVISQFPKLNIDILKGDITFTLSYGWRDFERRENILTGLDKYMEKTNTRIYGDYTIPKNYFFETVHFK